MIEINKNIVFVQGSHAGAIYNLNSGDVFSINNSSCDAIHKYIEGAEFNNGEKEYIDLVIVDIMMLTTTNGVSEVVGIRSIISMSITVIA